MSDTTAAPAKTPWWFWAICVLALLWNGFGAFDFLMYHLRGDAYCREMGMSEAQIAFMHSYPAWMFVVWFAGTWGAFIGSVLLVLRRRWAFHVFVISFAGFLLSLVYHYALSNGAQVMPSVPIHATIFVSCLFFIWFSRFATQKGLLR